MYILLVNVAFISHFIVENVAPVLIITVYIQAFSYEMQSSQELIVKLRRHKSITLPIRFFVFSNDPRKNVMEELSKAYTHPRRRSGLNLGRK